MKKLISILMCIVLCFAFAGCSGKTDDTNTTVEETEYSPYSEEKYERIMVDFATNDNGFYSLYADVTLGYYENELAEVFIENPALLAFKVSDIYSGGVCLIDGVDITLLINKLNLAQEAINNNDLESAKEYIANVLEFIKNQPIYDYCPT